MQLAVHSLGIMHARHQNTVRIRRDCLQYEEQFHTRAIINHTEFVYPHGYAQGFRESMQDPCRKVAGFVEIKKCPC